MIAIRNIARLIVLGLFMSTLMACSSNNANSVGGYNNDSYYRSGINNHHHRNYRSVKPPRRVIRR